jgi:hypothetical protein
MASQLGFSELEFNKDNNQNKNSSSRRRRNKTIKKKPEKTEKVKDFLNSLEALDTLEGMEDNTEGLANFEPLEPAKLSKQPAAVHEGFVDPGVTQEAYTTMNESTARNEEYYKQFVPYYKQATNNANLHGSKDELMEKLNYIIQVIEESKDERTTNISEELILYMFLGVFVIFVVDSFARAGKYTR